MRLKFSSFSAPFALLLGVALFVWLLLGDVQHFRAEPPATIQVQTPSLPRVEVRLSEAREHTPDLTLQGQLEPHRDIILRPRRTGTVAALPHPQGSRVEAGDTLLELDEEDLPEQLAQAEAELKLALSEREGARRLSGKNLVSSNEVLRLESAVAEARAELARLRQLRADARFKAPFTGVLDRLDVELGDFVQPGEDVGKLVEIDRLIATARAPQRRAPELRTGLPVTATLLSGEQLQGELSFVASSADSATRSYALEANLANPERLRIAGASATLDIALPSRQAHRLSPALLILDDRGRLGVKHLDDSDTVRFTPVSLLTADAHQTWVTGLPDQVRLITLGGGFVDLGEQVEAVPVNDEQES
ncbi:membrane fusion protein, multidrug efflux system [Modicisalibacter ilicicola DSM 19980]|uniref:Membrane fusion protein, multidrug efflux system n=1 Tax=Modicisalibacter ilicicola DSM 19980 TaxID=1121942 RepID=A0A1M4STC3_9GAMM|nr:efflux RND transporter periplasmic adaptor subunit [Halomonas ilicicola]SHE35446.1 membrane fusion protein, multidrug efflux system [Halomonas ilicicola DSM 19980]